MLESRRLISTLQLVLSAGLFLSSEVAHAVYKCGKTYQDAPCSADDGEKGKMNLNEDKRSEQQRWDSDVHRIQQSGRPFVAKYPYIYSYNGRQWVKEGFINGVKHFSIAQPSDDIDVARVNLQLRQQQSLIEQAKLARIQEENSRQLEAARANLDAKSLELQRSLDKYEADAKALRKEIACRGRSGYDPVCSEAKWN